MDKNLEVRSYGGDAAPTIDGRTIEGYAIVFNQRSEVMIDWSSDTGWRKFVEVISPEAVTEDLIQRSDIKATAEHNRERLLARSNKGKGTLSLTIDEYGLKYRFDAPNTNEGDFAVEMIKRGDIGGSSFAFRVKKPGEAWEKDGDLWVRTINSFDGLYDVTITTDPAYSQTDVSVRSLDEMDETIGSTAEAPEERKDETYIVNIELLKLKI